MSTQVTLGAPTPMLNVPDIKATIDWYLSIGFKLLQTSEKFIPDEPINWAYLERDGACLMLNLNEKCEHSTDSVTLYMTTNNVDSFYEEVKDKVKITEDIRNQFYGMRDFYFEDLNGFKFGVGQSIEIKK